MDTDDGWPKVWAEISDQELWDRLRHYPVSRGERSEPHAGRIALASQTASDNRR